MEGTPKAPDKLNLVNIVTVGIVGALLVYVSIIALQAYYKNTLDAEELARAVENADLERRDVESAQLEKLTKYATRDDQIRKKKVVVIPIERAMELVVAEAARNPNASLVPDVGAHDQPTVEAKPPYKALEVAAPAPAPAPPAPEGGAAPADGTAPAGDAPPAPAPAPGDATP